MLQQTQAATVIAYFERFLQAFPTLEELARADEQEVLRLWAGLGYYRRARDLLRAARILVKEHAGRICSDAAVLRKLPGFGRYTVNAVLSQAFDAPLPIIEANSRRVLARFFAYEQDPKSAAGERWLWQTAEALLPRSDSGRFNQAVMELGALVCTARAPRCGDCPLAPRCVAQARGLQERIPGSTPKQVEQVDEVALVVRRGGEVLLAQRPAVGRWANMWEFPHFAMQNEESCAAAAARLARSLGLSVRVGNEIALVKHSVTRFRISLHCFEAAYVRGELTTPLYVSRVWIEPPAIQSYPISSPQRRLAERLIADL